MAEARTARLPAWAWPLLALPIVAGVGAWTYWAVSSAVQVRLEARSRPCSPRARRPLGQWLDARGEPRRGDGGRPARARGRRGLIAVARRTGGDPAALKAAPAQAHLREVLAPVVSRQHNAGFFILDPGGLIVARIVDERVGERVVLTVADAAARVRDGRPVFLAPTLKQRFANVPMAFVMVPLRDASGAAIATFAFRIPAQQMGEILNASRLGETGETYAVDAEGHMSPRRRFPEQVAQLGLLPPEAGGRTTAALELRDPGVDSPRASRRDAAEDLAAHLGRGRGRRRPGRRQRDGLPRLPGREVVGAWHWLPQWGFGIVTEIDRAEAYQTLAVVRRAFGVLGGGLLLVAAAPSRSPLAASTGCRGRSTRGSALGQYTLEDKIGEGGMGAVYRARHAFLRRPTAIKLIRSEMATPEMLARFEREVQLTSQLTHPNTIAIYDYGRTPDGVFYYAMEYLPGLPLDRVILDDGPQPEARVVHLRSRSARRWPRRTRSRSSTATSSPRT